MMANMTTLSRPKNARRSHSMRLNNVLKILKSLMNTEAGREKRQALEERIRRTRGSMYVFNIQRYVISLIP
jgi:hypothetical protein